MAKVIGKCEIAPDSKISGSAIIGKLFRPLFEGSIKADTLTIIKNNVHIGDFCIIGQGSIVDKNCKIDDFCKIECNVVVGKNTILMNRALLQNQVKVGDDCIIASIIGERAIIGNRCRIFGGFAHIHIDPSVPWDADEAAESPPILEDDVFVGFNSTLLGGIRLSKKSYVCAGSVLSKDLPSFHIAYGFNEICHYKNWRGKLKESNFFVL